ncbi:ribosomal RNA small subunit methyltransferase E [Cellvibrio zantedeschiae]|uniref:Ribosomal RNA small subunit methyltransferase E n=1 Tax=Cellvibrio zantedeschiae TaxID=1237077 RepID=A0ABQ3AZE7_9GAMM|nr:16S rRNA (uracil(1498)-N(3))-methyltransferase [Cellvibrio zantedeschiae]GGY72547.1 ribosomal RNA small subunit methyltransferase E [Cellvibrio zantedeschiae]
MNLVLFSEADFIGDRLIAIRDSRRLQHISQVHQVKVGETLKVGLLNGNMGSGLVVLYNETEIQLEVTLTQAPPKPLPVTLILALPRPKMLKRTLQTIATLGVKKIYLINSYRVEKSYWQTPLLEPGAIYEHLLLGLEQGCDTLLPEVHLIKRFKPFVEDDLSSIVGSTRALVAHPYTDLPCPAQIDYAITLAIGPEGGFIPYEIDLLKKSAGFTAVNLGERIMRVETVVPYLLGRLY